MTSTKDFAGHPGRQAAPSLGTEIRYTLMAASIASQSEQVTAQLLKQLVQTGIWSRQRGLDHARRLAAPADRFKALLTVHHTDPAPADGSVIAEALAPVSWLV
jgi:hypothetical protein